MADGRFDGIPLILETTKPELWPEEIKELKHLAGLVSRLVNRDA